MFTYDKETRSRKEAQFVYLYRSPFLIWCAVYHQNQRVLRLMVYQTDCIQESFEIWFANKWSQKWLLSCSIQFLFDSEAKWEHFMNNKWYSGKKKLNCYETVVLKYSSERRTTKIFRHLVLRFSKILGLILHKELFFIYFQINNFFVN